jgi:Uma2 family endonuclease
MNAQPLEKSKMTPEAYLEFENTSEIRHEFFRGELFAMTGGSLNHNRISRNIVRSLGNQLAGSPCEPFAGDMRVKVQENEKYTYPDIVIVCGEIELEKIKGVETLLNPVVIMEILSTATEAYDRGRKFEHYRMIPSLREYFLFSQNECQVERFLRGDDGIWQILDPVKGMDQIVPIASASCDLKLADVYELVEFETGG